MRSSSRRGQVATEYLIILAVVIVISLIVVGVLRSFTTVRTGFDIAKAKFEWSSQTLSLSAYTLYANGSGVLYLTNNEAYPIKVTQAGIGLNPVEQPTPKTINAGATDLITLAPGSVLTGTQGADYSLDVTLKYAHAQQPTLVSTAKGKVNGVYE